MTVALETVDGVGDVLVDARDALTSPTRKPTEKCSAPGRARPSGSLLTLLTAANPPAPPT